MSNFQEEKNIIHVLYTSTVYQSTRTMHVLLTQYTLECLPRYTASVCRQTPHRSIVYSSTQIERVQLTKAKDFAGKGATIHKL